MRIVDTLTFTNAPKTATGDLEPGLRLVSDTVHAVGNAVRWRVDESTSTNFWTMEICPAERRQPEKM